MSDDSNLLQMINQKLDRLLSRGERKPAPAPEPPPPPRERRPAFEWLKKQPDERHEDWLRRCNITDADNGLCIDMARAGREHDARMRARPMRRPSEDASKVQRDVVVHQLVFDRCTINPTSEPQSLRLKLHGF